MVTLSIYGTVYNNGYIIENSLTSLIHTLKKHNIDFEIVIVDNYSTDNTWEKLQKLQRIFHEIKLIRCHCTRGQGRKIAFHLSSGKYVMYVDFDCIFLNLFGRVVKNILKVLKPGEIWFRGLAYRNTMLKIGDWKNLNYGEDWELYCRAVVNNIKVKYLMIYPPFINIKNSLYKRVSGEKRYTSGKITYMKRTTKIILDDLFSYRSSIIETLLNIKSSRMRYYNLFKLALLYVLFPIYIYKYSKFRRKGFINTLECVYSKAHFVFPDEINLSNDLFYVNFESVELLWRHIIKIIKNVIIPKTGAHINFIFKKQYKTLQIYTNRNVYLSYLMIKRLLNRGICLGRQINKYNSCIQKLVSKYPWWS